jgi:branched-chain amino acid aminotransferase
MSEPIAYLNGAWLPQSRAGLPLHDAGFVMGVTVVDFIRTFRRRLDSWPRHLARFQRNVANVGIGPWTYSDDALTALAEEIITRNTALLAPHQELTLIVFATPGPLGAYIGQPELQGPPTLGLHTFPLAFDRYRETIRDGARLRSCRSIVAPISPWISPTIKHRSRLHWWLAEHETGDAKPLLLDANGHVTETSFANVVIVRDGDVVSPRRDAILPGVSLETVEELCGEIGVTFREADLTVADCLAADEVLLCGTAFCLARARELDDVPLPPIGTIYRKLSEAWSRRLGLDFAAQILGENQ